MINPETSHRSATDREKGDGEFVAFGHVLLRELDVVLSEGSDIHKDLKHKFDQSDPKKLLDEKDVFKFILENIPLAGLCFSGGGIRSATFNLGILQALAENNLLSKFHYLSTVSGGGYIGSWLSAWIGRCGGLKRVEEALTVGVTKNRREIHQTNFLRNYSNYLTPMAGIFTVDTWSVITTCLRNLLLNWLILIPLFLAIVLLPRLYLVLQYLLQKDCPLLQQELLAAGLAFGAVSLAFVGVHLPGVGNRRTSQPKVLRYFLVSIFLSASSLSLWWSKVWPALPFQTEFRPHLLEFCLSGAAVHGVGWGAALLYVAADRKREKDWRVLLFSFVLALSAGGVAGGLAWAVGTMILPAMTATTGFPMLLYVTTSVPMILGVYLLSGMLFVGMMSPFTGEEDREWWSRSGAWVLLGSLLWFAGCITTFYGPAVLLSDGLSKAFASLGGISGITAALLGKSAATPATLGISGDKNSVIRRYITHIAAGIFILFLFASMSLLGSWIEWKATSGSLAPERTPFNCRWYSLYSGTSFDILDHFGSVCYECTDDPRFVPLLLMFGISTIICFVSAFIVKINKFSLHAMYKNRLIRAYLGASHLHRRPNRFTGFDPEDDMPMSHLKHKPLHLINMTWNVVKGKRLAWQERKGISFTVSPLYCGSAGFGYRPTSQYGSDEKKQGISIGTAMAISGAAASPNMGYNSSPLITFIMAFFNMRLGWWLGNPAPDMGDVWRKNGPGFSLRPLVREMFGLTDEKSPDIYLSDGGHFENLGLYELVRRRCRYIVVTDAGCDKDTHFDDLGNAIRKIRVDLGIDVILDTEPLRRKKDRQHWVVGKIMYNHDADGNKQGQCNWNNKDDKDPPEGTILYIKPTITGDEPADILNYKSLHHDFPHQSTVDQWFNESQFESYRMLGYHSLSALLKEEVSDVDELFRSAKASTTSKTKRKRLYRAHLSWTLKK